MMTLNWSDAVDSTLGWAEQLCATFTAASHWYFNQIHGFLPEPFFNTQAFLKFFALVFTLYWLIPRRWPNARIWMLVAASFHFYAAWSRELAFLVLSTTIADYIFGRCMAASERRGLRFGTMLTSIVMNLGVLSYFKYRGFFLNELHAALEHLGYRPGYGRLDLETVIVPFGISFYTFEAISYTVDVYRRRVAAERSLPRFLLFILFFPHLVSGPIVRAGDFLQQTRRPKRWNWLRIQAGVQLFLMGVFKKMAIADHMALYCDPVFKSPEAYSSGACWLAVLAYSIRIYCDFSGYSDMAVGLAHLFGYKLTRNFDMPYSSANVSEFWRRWHISLSTWLRDYVFIPLGGSRGSRWLNYRNLLATMVLGGLWHGAAWGYVAWGAAHGILLVAHRQFKDFCATRPRLDAALQSGPGTACRVFVTFLTVSLCWVLFQPLLWKAGRMYEQLFGIRGGQASPLSPSMLWYTAGFVACCHLLAGSGAWRWFSARLPAPLFGLGYAACACAAMLLAPNSESSFIYFQF